MPAAKFEIKRKCSICGEEFLAKTIESWYCSPRCSKIAWKRRKDEEKRNLRLDEVVKSIPKDQDYIKVSEAYALFGISRDTLYRLIRKEPGKSSVSCPLTPSDSAPLGYINPPPLIAL